MAGPLILEESPPARRKGDATRYGQVYIKSLTLLRSLSSFRRVTPRMRIAYYTLDAIPTRRVPEYRGPRGRWLGHQGDCRAIQLVDTCRP